MPKPRLRRLVRRWTIGLLVATAVVVLLCNRWVINSTDSRLYRNWAQLPENEYGLIPGTSTYTRAGASNPQFHGRIQAAAELYHLGKIRRLIVSGANPDATYNEPRRMRDALIQAGVPAEAIIMDFAGDRTFDSVARARDVFGLMQMTIITQRYHAYRALFLARKMGMQAVAYRAPIQGQDDPEFRHPPREVFARVLAVMDLFVLRTDARSGAIQDTGVER
jgi:SanA protein